MRIEWDATKEEANRRKRSVAFCRVCPHQSFQTASPGSVTDLIGTSLKVTFPSNSNAAETGFLAAITIIAGILNLNWKHYIRYFVGRDRQLGTTRVRIIRWGFLLVFLSSLCQFGFSLFALEHSGRELGGSIIVASGTLLAFAVIDGFFRLLWR